MSSVDHALYSGAYLIPGEDREEFATLCEEYRRRFGPDSADTEFLVASLIHTEWRMRRYRKVETELIELSSRGATRQYPPPELENTAFLQVRKHLEALGRSYQADLRLLLKLRGDDGPGGDGKRKTRKLGPVRQSGRDAAGPYIVAPPPRKTRPN